MKNIFSDVFDFFASPDRLLGKAVLAGDVSRVKKAFAKGANPDASHKFRACWTGGIWPVSAIVTEPVLETARRVAVPEIVEEIQRRKRLKELDV